MKRIFAIGIALMSLMTLADTNSVESTERNYAQLQRRIERIERELKLAPLPTKAEVAEARSALYGAWRLNAYDREMKKLMELVRQKCDTDKQKSDNFSAIKEQHSVIKEFGKIDLIAGKKNLKMAKNVLMRAGYVNEEDNLDLFINWAPAKTEEGHKKSVDSVLGRIIPLTQD